MTGKKSIDPQQPGKESGKSETEWGSGTKETQRFSDGNRHGQHPPDTLHQGQKDLHRPKPKKH